MSMIISSSSKKQTASFFMPESTLLAQTDVAVYLYDATSKDVSAVNGYQPSNGAFQWYQACEVLGEGSWWFPVAAVNLVPFQWNDTTTGGITDLQSTGNGIWTSEGSNRMVRPAALFWWIPAATLKSGVPVEPGSNNNAPLGDFPEASPFPPPAEPTVENENGQITITIPPENDTTTINIQTG